MGVHSRASPFPKSCDFIHHLFNSFFPCVSVTFLVAVTIWKSNLGKKGLFGFWSEGTACHRGMYKSVTAAPALRQEYEAAGCIVPTSRKREMHAHDPIASSFYSVPGPRPKNSALPSMFRVGLPLLSWTYLQKAQISFVSWVIPVPIKFAIGVNHYTPILNISLWTASHVDRVEHKLESCRGPLRPDFFSRLFLSPSG